MSGSTNECSIKMSTHIACRKDFFKSQWLYHEEDKCHVDVIFKTVDGKEVSFHSLILAPSSTLLTTCLSSSTFPQLVLLPDYEWAYVNAVKSLLYTGRCEVHKSMSADLMQLIKDLGLEGSWTADIPKERSTAPCIPRRSPIQVLTWLNVA